MKRLLFAVATTLLAACADFDKAKTNYCAANPSTEGCDAGTGGSSANGGGAANGGGSATGGGAATGGGMQTAPTSVTYSPADLVCTRTQPCSATASVVGGVPTSFMISPALTDSFLLATTTGKITGTPQALQAKTLYTVTASNPLGGAMTTFTLTVNEVPPTNLTYSPSTLQCQQNIACSLMAPVAQGGPIAGFAISPTLPDGLVFDTTTGAVSGAGTALSVLTPYTVTASNSGGMVSAMVSIAVSPAPPIISPQPQNLSVELTQSASFTVGTSGTGTLAYQWMKNDAGIAGATQSTYTIASTALTDNGTFKVAVSDTYGNNVESSPATLTVTNGIFSSPVDAGIAREGHTATELADGTVLIAGGFSAGFALTKSAQIFDPSTNRFTATGNMMLARAGFTATRLPSGKVLIAGGGAGTNNTLTTAAEVYDPTLGTFQTTGAMMGNHYAPTATLLRTGKVLIVGGSSFSTGGAIASCELYDPLTGTFATTGSLNQPRFQTTATLLPSGKVLIAGGQGSSTYLKSTEIYDPATGAFTAGPDMSVIRNTHMAVLLPTGKVLIVGGFDGSFADLYDPVAQTFTLAVDMGTNRGETTAVLLNSGKVLIAAGVDQTQQGIATAILYDPIANTLTPTGSLSVARGSPTVTPLWTGKVLITGGQDATDMPVAVAELYDPQDARPGTFVMTGHLTEAFMVARSSQTATALYNGQVLYAGGVDGTGAWSSTDELYDVISGTFITATGTPTERTLHTATVLPNGLVLLAGGRGSAGVVAVAELYDPATQQFTPTGSLQTPRTSHTATLLPNGLVLIAGGVDTVGSPVVVSELYDVRTGTFTNGAHLNTPRSLHTATMLGTGQVMIAGGFGSATLAGYEMYDYTENAFAPIGSLSTARSQHTATLLHDGSVLLAGGLASGVYLDSTDVYSVPNFGFTPSGMLQQPSQGHVAAVLPDGNVLFGDEYNPTDTYDEYGEVYRNGTLTRTTNKMVAVSQGATATRLWTGRILIGGGVNYFTQLYW